MDASRFDQLAVSVAHAAGSRRSLLHRLAGGSVAAALAAIGIGDFTSEDAEAQKKKKKKKGGSCRKRCTQRGWSRAKRQACKAKCKKAGGGAGTGGGGTTTCSTNAQCSGGLACINKTCQACTLASQCDGLVCVDGLCVGAGPTGCTAVPDTCPDPLICVGTVCVLPGTACVGGVGGSCPTAGETCLLGICVEECTGPTDTCSGGAAEVCVLGICVAA